MIARTHLAFALLIALLFLPYVPDKILFLVIVFLATLLVDIDSGSSLIGRRVKIFSFFVKHRGIIHSFSFCIILSLLIALFFPFIALPFFLGYFSHIFIDSFTKEGIQPFWPYEKRSLGLLRTGGKAETILFVALFLIDIFLIYFQLIGKF